MEEKQLKTFVKIMALEMSKSNKWLKAMSKAALVKN